LYCGQTAAWIKMPLGTDVGLGLSGRPRPTRIVLDGDPAPPPLKGHIPQFSANVRFGQTAPWTKMPLGVQVGLGSRNFVFDGDPATPRKKGPTHPHPIFGPCLLWPNGWMKMPLGTEVDLSPGHIVLHRVLALCERGTAAPALFSAMSFVAMVAHLSYY